MLIGIDAPHFVAAVEVVRGRVVRAAPILKYMRGWTVENVAEYAARKGWKFRVISTDEST